MKQTLKHMIKQNSEHEQNFCSEAEMVYNCGDNVS